VSGERERYVCSYTYSTVELEGGYRHLFYFILFVNFGYISLAAVTCSLVEPAS